MSVIKVLKSDGSKVDIELHKIHKMVEKACKDITGVSESMVEMNSGLQFYDGITTKDVQSILVKSASDLISLENPNYQFVAARLLLFGVQKVVFNTKWKDNEIYPSLGDIIDRNIKQGVYDKDILNHYSKEQIAECNKYIRHNRDLTFTYAGLQQIVDKYLVQDRSNGEIFETPQFMYMLIAMTLFKSYGENRVEYIRKYYDAISQYKINIPTPIMAGVRTPYGSSHHVYSLIQQIPSIQSFRVTWQSEDMLHKELVLELMQEEYEDLVQGFVVEKYNTLV